MSRIWKAALGAVVIAPFSLGGCTPDNQTAVKVGGPDPSRPSGNETASGTGKVGAPDGGTATSDKSAPPSQGTTAPPGQAGPGGAGSEKAPNGAQPSPRPQNGQPGAPQGGPGAGGQGGRRGLGGSPLGLLRMDDVQAEIKLSEDQKKKLEGVIASVRGPGGPGGQGGERPDPDAMRQRMEKAQKDADQILNASQKTRLEELMIQREGTGALNRPEVSSKLGLSDAQKKQIADLQQKMGEKMREMFQSRPGGAPGAPGAPGGGAGNAPGGGRNPGGGGQDNRGRFEEMAKLREETQTKAMGVLTAEQKSKFKAMQGKPFEFKQRGFGGGGGRGGNGPGGGQNRSGASSGA